MRHIIYQLKTVFKNHTKKKKMKVYMHILNINNEVLY